MCVACNIKMEDVIHGRRPQLKTTPMEDDLSVIVDSTLNDEL
jgi:hypothetical protein